MELFQNTDFWLGLMLIIWINIILSGDNAVVIALAARSLPPEQQKKAIMFGSGAAVVLRIGLTVVAAFCCCGLALNCSPVKTKMTAKAANKAACLQPFARS
jgi:predicted tellurium resistance membrane protein TerC